MTDSKDNLGDRMKEYERAQTEKKLDDKLPVYARIDGRGFSKFTKGIERPFSPEMHASMVETTKYLVHETKANFGYTQSDEISLGWVPSGNPESQFMFSGKVQKLASVFSGMATIAFYKNFSKLYCESIGIDSDKYLDKYPHFDCRIFNVPDIDELTNSLYWRFIDAHKNSVSMAARSIFSHKELQNKNSLDMINMLLKRGIDYHSYLTEFRFGTYVFKTPNISRRVIHTASLNFSDLDHNARKALIL